MAWRNKTRKRKKTLAKAGLPGKKKKVKSFFVRAKKFFSGKKKAEWVSTLKFTLLVLALFLVLNYLFGSVLGLRWLEWLNAWLSAVLLQALGYESSVLSGQAIELVSSSVRAEINLLCTGKTEMLLLISATIASLGINIKKRIAGAVGAVITVLVFNPVRITTTMIMLVDGDVHTADLWHSILFRLSLFAVIIGYYFTWFFWATIKKKKK